MLKLASYWVAVASLAGSSYGQTLPNGVASGDTTQTTTVLWTRSTAVGANVTFEYSTDPTFATVQGTLSVPVTDASVPVKAEVTGLLPQTQYYYRATDGAGASSTGRFRTPAPVDTRAGLRFGVSGDSLGTFKPYRSLDNAVARDLDFFVALGDTAYADYPTPAGGPASTLGEFRAKHGEVYEDARLAALRASTTLLTVYDDHEVVDNFSGGAPPSSDPRFDNNGAFINETNLFNNGIQAFVEYNPIRDEFYGDTGDSRTAFKRRFYRSITQGTDSALFLLDTRSFRDEAIADPDLSGIGDWIADTFDPSRPLLGQAQLVDLKQDLLEAQQGGVTWKFVMVPEPIQYLGPVGSSDRFESYAAERSEILRFINDNDVENVVFVSADIHQTIVNDLSYRNGPNAPDIGVDAFEISTGAIGFEPGGVTIIEAAHDQGLISDEDHNAYLVMSLTEKDAFLAQFFEGLRGVLPFFGYYDINPFGLEDSGLDAELLAGAWIVGHTLGWTEFEIDGLTQQLTVTTYGVDPGIGIPQTPEIFSQFVVNPVPEPTTFALAGLGILAFSHRRDRRRQAAWSGPA